LVFKNQAFNFANIDNADPPIFCQNNGGKPKLAFTITSFHMNMGRFIAFIRIKMKPKA